MLRAVLLGVVSVSAMSGVACKSQSDAAKTQPGGVAGKVIEVGGAVTVKHAGAPRALAQGESVEADDVIETGADGHVRIELAHNLASWELGPNKSQKVRDSLAWGLAKKTEPAGEVQQDTAAAGRPAERSAADTTATAAEPVAPPAAQPAPPAAAALEEAAPVKEDKAPAKKERHRSRERAKESSKDAAPELEKKAMRAEFPTAESMSAEGGGGGGTRRGATLAPPKIAAPMPMSPQLMLDDKRGDLQKCMAGTKEPVTLIVNVAASGAATPTLTSKAKVSAELEACVKKVVASLHFYAAAGTATLTLKP